MYSISYTIPFVFFCWLIIGCKSKSAENLTTTASHPYQSILDSMYQAQPETIGIMAHIESPKKGISWSGGVGYSDMDNKTKLSPDQPALIASCIKTYIAATILRLQEQGKLSIEDNISQHLTPKTHHLFEADGYDFNRIKIKHLLSHTSGIQDYADDDYLDEVDKNPTYRWTRDEQLARATQVGNPLGEPAETFSYADVNYLLSTEIIEVVTKQPFYEAMRELLQYEALELNDTWFPILEKEKAASSPLVHQYWKDKNWDSYHLDASWDLYGGGGIATTTADLARFSHHLFNGEIIKDTAVFDLIYTDIATRDGVNHNYGLGLAKADMKGWKGYGHAGFWGTSVFYFPDIDASIAVFVLERNHEGLQYAVLAALVEELAADKK